MKVMSSIFNLVRRTKQSTNSKLLTNIFPDEFLKILQWNLLTLVFPFTSPRPTMVSSSQSTMSGFDLSIATAKLTLNIIVVENVFQMTFE